MGNIIGSTMESNFNKQQEFMTEMNRITLERQIQMQNQMREKIAASQVARARDVFLWFGSFYSIATIGMVMGFRHTKKPIAIAPLLPLTFILGYQWDLAYGTKMNRIISEAENILMFEKDVIEIPGGLPTISSLDIGRLEMAESAKFKAINEK